MDSRHGQPDSCSCFEPLEPRLLLSSSLVPAYNLPLEAPAHAACDPSLDSPHPQGIDIIGNGDGTDGIVPGLLQDTGSVLPGGGAGVYLNSGEFFVHATDLEIPGRGFDWTFERTYRSGVEYDGPLGHNWFLNYNQHLVVVTEDNQGQVYPGFGTVAPGDVLRVDGYGRMDIYRSNGDGTYGAHAEDTARNDAVISWQPTGATGYKVYEDGVCIDTLDAGVTGYEAADPLGHDYQVQALYGSKSSRLSYNAQLVSHNPWFSDSCELGGEFTVSGGYAESVLIDPEVTEGFESMWYTGAAGGVVLIGLTDEDCSGTQVSPAWRSGTSESWSITEVDPFNHAGYGSSVIQDHMSHAPDKKTYLTVYFSSGPGGATVDVDVFNITPHWIDIGVAATGGGMANIGTEEYPDWVDCSGQSETGEKVPGTGGAYVPGREGDMDEDGIPDSGDTIPILY